jgi:hypothetical protein
MSMLDWNAYASSSRCGFREIAKMSPDTIRGYQALSVAGQEPICSGPRSAS